MFADFLKTRSTSAARPEWLAVIACLLSLAMESRAAHAQTLAVEAKFDRVWNLVNDHFYDATFNGVDWDAAKRKYVPLVRQCDDISALSDVVNAMLSELETSHTRYYTQFDTAYYFLSSLFQPVYPAELIEALFPGGKIRYDGIGMFTRRINGDYYVVGVVDGGPADTAGLRRGQRLVSGNGSSFHPIRSFLDMAGEPVELVVQQAADPRNVERVVVRPISIDPQALMLTALESSMRVVRKDGSAIAYAHMWSYAGEHLHQRLKAEIASGTFRDADALVLDLRDGWGGANPEYISLFSHQVPHLTYFDRKESGVSMGHWCKPVALLINEGTRSGKELIAHAFRKHHLGPVVGTKSAGAVTAGRFFLFDDGTGLYLAVRGIRVDGEVLEGRGVAPEHRVPWPFPYGPAADPQLQAALELLRRDLQQDSE